MKPILKTLLAACVTTCLAPHAARAASSSGPEAKYIQVCNNFSKQTIWLTLGSTQPGQAEVHSLNGHPIAPRECYQSPSLSLDKWNAGRIYIFPVNPAGVADPYAVAGNYQLVEYTFRGLTGVGATYGQGIGYDYSAVDSLHSGLPVAVEAGNDDGDVATAVPYTGNPMSADYDEDTSKLRLEFQRLIDAGWPFFTVSSVPGTYYKIPGGYNLFAEAGVRSYTYAKGARTQITPDFLAGKWLHWIQGSADSLCPVHVTPDQDFCRSFQQSVRTVWNAFLANARENGVHNPSPIEVAQHIIGFVPFGANWSDIDGNVGLLWTAIASGMPSPAYMKDAKYTAARYPDYDSPYNLDPYVTAVHKALGLNVYAFSIDDSLGYFDVPSQNKLFISVGGLHGLPNKTQAQPPVHSPYRANFGPGWTSMTACATAVKLDPSIGSSTTLPVDTQTPCDVVYHDDRNHAVAFHVSLKDGNALNLSQCVGDRRTCEGVYIYENNVQGPPPPSGEGLEDASGL